MEATALAMTGVRKRWPKVAAPVLDGVDLEIAPGEMVGVAGRNGAGKTTLLRIAAGVLAADEGSVTVCGLRDRTAAQRQVGVCAAGNGGLYGRLGVQAHLDLWARLALLGRDERRAAIARARADFALDDFGDRRVDRLSMGQRQRLRLAGAFLHDPALVLLDEPRTSLDAEAWELVAGAITAARGRGAAVLVCFPSGEGDPVAFDRRHEVRDARLVAA